ncbi:hypothetical protein [Clostridium botulinum]|uniref:hypothetical protein n=1 Tax=Clostridium botulinum TaxID=1491 RepID=UPI001C9ACDCC|nr:hypothetical protein [Clostridium botulinum]MBY6838677.1 hypothetical protein [Clostridium botulinum]
MLNTILLILGLYICTFAIITRCDNFISKLVFQIPQFLGGLYLIFMFFKLQGYITL